MIKTNPTKFHLQNLHLLPAVLQMLQAFPPCPLTWHWAFANHSNTTMLIFHAFSFGQMWVCLFRNKTCQTLLHALSDLLYLRSIATYCTASHGIPFSQVANLGVSTETCTCA